MLLPPARRTSFLRRAVPFCLAVSTSIGVLAGGRPARGATTEEISQSIRKGVAWLYDEQKPDGTWELSSQRDPAKGQAFVEGGQWGGLTALATLSLLAAGESPNNEKLARALKFLKNADIRGIYALGLRAQCWPLLPDSPERKTLARRDGQLLMQGIRKSGKNVGLYGYFAAGGDPNFGDHSVSLYGVLGVRAWAQCGFEVSDAYWAAVDQAWRSGQLPDGSWSYTGNDPGRVNMNMTASGVAVLFVTQDYLSLGRSLACAGTVVDPKIDAGIQWVDKHYAEALAARPLEEFTLNNYALYALEKVGAAGGRKYFNARDWYQEGAAMALHNQQEDGSWGKAGGVPDTALAILFLVRGRAPVVLNKLQYDVAGKEGNWDERPRDAANVANWIGGQIEQELGWQSVTLKAPVEELHDSPILYLAGNQALAFTAEEQAKLKLFVEQGGIILGNADCQDRAFSASFKSLGKKLFPDYEFRELPREHVIYTDELYKADRWRSRLSVLGMSNGARELMLLLPLADASKAWQINQPVGKENLYQLMADVFLYAVDRREARFRGDTYLVQRDPAAGPAEKSIKVARLQYTGNWDPEPGGWRRLDAVMHNTRKTDLTVTPIPLGQGKVTSDFNVAHLTGTGKFKLDAPARAELKKYVDAGGTLVIDACGGDGDFATAAEAELAAIFPDAKAEVLPPDAPIYAAGGKLPASPYRRFVAKSLDAEARATPRVRGITINGRTAVYYSPEDLSEGLVGQPIDGVRGYTPAAATIIMSDIVSATGK